MAVALLTTPAGGTRALPSLAQVTGDAGTLLSLVDRSAGKRGHHLEEVADLKGLSHDGDQASSAATTMPANRSDPEQGRAGDIAVFFQSATLPRPVSVAAGTRVPVRKRCGGFRESNSSSPLPITALPRNCAST